MNTKQESPDHEVLRSQQEFLEAEVTWRSAQVLTVWSAVQHSSDVVDRFLLITGRNRNARLRINNRSNRKDMIFLYVPHNSTDESPQLVPALSLMNPQHKLTASRSKISCIHVVSSIFLAVVSFLISD
jgi:hypothetical protein